MLKLLVLAAAGSLTLAPAYAADYREAKSLCAEAVAASLDRNGDDARVRLKRIRDYRTTQITVRVEFEDGFKAVGECEVGDREVRLTNVAA